MILFERSNQRPILSWMVSALLALMLLLTAGPGAPALAQEDSPTDLEPAAVSAASQCFYPVADAYVAYEQLVPGTGNTNYGGEPALLVQHTDVGETQKSVFLRFDLSPIPSDATIIAADLELYLTAASASATYHLNRATSSWQEYNITWNNRPGSGGGYDAPTHTANTGRKYWDATQPVSDWVGGVYANHGLVVSTGLLEAATSFASREGSIYEAPRLCVQWDIGITADLEVTGLEVTQAVQDLSNSVRLVAGKRTFVRLHARSAQNDYRTFATLAVSCDNFGRVLHPVNPGTSGYITVRETPSRNVQNHAFLFELPSDCTDEAEEIRISGLVNPVTAWRGEYPPEDNILNNWSGEYFLTFESTPQLDTIVYLADYQTSGGTFTTATTDAYMLRDWLKRAYPIASTTLIIREIDLGQVTVNITGTITSPNSDDFNVELAAKRDWDLAHDNWYESITGDERHIRYYGMIDDAGGFMRGSSADIPSTVASGPTGDGRWTWDTDGSFGDWYGGHEIGHTLGRSHVNCNGREVGPDANYPHTGGFISTSTTGDDAFFGFDSGDLVDGIYGPTWSDVMSYCSWQWISDYTSHGILDYMQDNFAADRAVAAAGSHLQVVGTIEASNGTTKLKPFFVLPSVVDAEPQVPGDYDIILRTAGGGELARYAFTPTQMNPGPPSPDAPRASQPAKLLISEMVPFVSGTDSVVIEGPSGVLAEVSAGSNAPSVTVVSPNGGENITSDPVTVSWNASDPDVGDVLAFSVEFSPDNGATWELLAHGISANSVNIPRQNLLSTEYQGLFRVWASDGIHSSSDTSNAGFRIPTRAPELTVVSPEDGLIIASEQSLHLQAIAYSDVAGILDGDQIRWVSVGKDGVLGFGADLVVTGLSVGTHTISVLADDGKRTSSEVFEVHVVANPSLLPESVQGLQVSPRHMALHPDAGVTSAQVNIDSASGTNPLNWLAVEVTSWIELNRTSGTTSDQVTISVDATDLLPGDYSANVLFLTPDIPGGDSKAVQVSFTIPSEPFRVYLPLVLR